MTPEHWQAVLSRIGAEAPADLDEEVSPKIRPRKGAGLSVWNDGTPPPSPRLWDRPEAGLSQIGIRIDDTFAGEEIAVALRLAAAALERGVVPLILAVGDGPVFLERFGFRVERFVGDSADDRAAWEAEMTAFWDLALIIDARDVVVFG
ncbi:hypothetical protein DEA8626_02383 [Defluviimonas aquaemixtae]|uniref:Uncharacterized protein n=1 Tax=Albidovulum aquaemixtae TaxID=1542388 RepID=A0A2R8BIT1_9RHOB|nr:hypothetical protein [Defluviimonas aquaemixtae]SPH23319.1 hypothetical protein DEA8626_02383 [Defluviimonas aquaemixtae]